MELQFVINILCTFIISILLTYLLVSNRANRKVTEYRTLSEAVFLTKTDLKELSKELDQAKELFVKTDHETKELQELKRNADKIASDLNENREQLSTVRNEIQKAKDESEENRKLLHEIMAKVDLYSRVDEFVGHGHFEEPEYLYETSARFAEEIKLVREKQKDFISRKTAVLYPESVVVSPDKTQNKRILQGQVRQMLAAFNIECDMLIGKVSPSSFPRTLERIENLAKNIEKSAATLHCGFNIDYVKLKYEECRLQYQFKLKKQHEQEEQRLIREQIREEQKAIQEFEKAIAQAEKEERMYRTMLEKAKAELGRATAEERLVAEARIADLERQLAEAEEKEERAKSMAEQTRRGHVYVISNIGSFGEDVFKIGLTRRLEPLDRVKELGDASVPFPFDVHAMIYSADAPALETALHREFTAKRVNAVNLRKEFFRVDLVSIKKAVEKMSDAEAEFKMTILAEEYFETRRLQGIETSAA